MKSRHQPVDVERSHYRLSILSVLRTPPFPSSAELSYRCCGGCRLRSFQDCANLSSVAEYTSARIIISTESSRRDLFIYVIVERFIFKRNQITLSPCFTFIPKTGVHLLANPG